MIKYIDADGVAHDVFITDNNYHPGQLADENGVISDYYTNTVSGTDGIVMQHTYNDKIDLLKIYGKSVQDGEPSPDNPIAIQSVGGTLSVGGVVYRTVIPEARRKSKGIVVAIDQQQKITITGGGANYGGSTYANITADTGLIFQNYGAYCTTITSPDQCWAFSPGTYYVNVFNFSGTYGETAIPSIRVVRFDETFSSSYHPAVANRELTGDLTMQFTVEEFGYYLLGIGFGTVANCDYGDDGVSFQLSVTDFPSDGLYYLPTTMDVPVLQSMDGVQDVLWVDRSQARAWVARGDGTSEELAYSPLPTFPKCTTATYTDTNDAEATVEATVKGYLIDNRIDNALIALGVEPSADQAENLEMLTELGVNVYA